MKIKARINDVTYTSDPCCIKYSKDAVDKGIDPSKLYVVVQDSVVIGTASIKYNFPVLEIEADCCGYISQESAKELVLERSGLIWDIDKDRVISEWTLCNFTLRDTKDNEKSNIIEFSN